MLKKLAGYTIISFLSFCVFSLFLNTAANAKGSGSDIFASVLGKSTTKSASPTPPPPIAVIIPTKPPSDPSPTEETPTAVPTSAPTTAPTTAPTSAPTSAPTDTPTEAPPSPTPTLDSLFDQYSHDPQYPNVDENLLKAIAQCESTNNPTADSNPPFVGLYQFRPDSWTSVRTAMNLNTDSNLRSNAEESIRTAAYILSQGNKEQYWPNCPHS